MSEISTTENKLRLAKKEKLEQLKALGVSPYPYSFDKNDSIIEIKNDFENVLEAGDKLEDKIYKIAGRLMAKREMGKSVFFDIQDQSGTMQAYLGKKQISEEQAQIFDLIDIGDFVGVTGYIFKTKMGELSIHCQDFEILSKSIEPLPEKHHGLQDKELRYRHRSLDLIMNPEVRKTFETRSCIIREIRNFLDGRGFMEVETPILQPIYGGANAYPFSTHHRALDMTLYLRISPELYLKRIVTGGFEKVYDINKNFRNEGIDHTHNPEFTMIEWYEAYTDYNYQMTQVEELITHLVQTIHGTTKINYQGQEIDFKAPWRRLSVHDGLREYAGIDPDTITENELITAIKKVNPGFDKKGLSRGELLMELFEETAEEHLVQPTFVIDHPVEVSPLTKFHRTKKGVVERFELFIANMECTNAYSELNDPQEQLKRLGEQEEKRVVDEEAQPMDEDFIKAVEVGMPPMGGVGMGIDRIVMLLTNNDSIRDVILFPTMKLKN